MYSHGVGMRLVSPIIQQLLIIIIIIIIIIFEIYIANRKATTGIGKVFSAPLC